MRIYFPHVAFTPEDILGGKINQKNLSESERYILNFVKDWLSGVDTFSFRTSGSTGTPKTINLSRRQLAYSAEETLRFLFPAQKAKNMLLCLNPHVIGGTQMITRALLADADLYVIPPSSDPLAANDRHFDLAAMVPLQISHALKHPDQFNRIQHVLIGGAALNQQTRERLKKLPTTKFYETYGMTETASHIAVKKIDETHFTPLGDIRLALDERDCLRCCGTVTANEWLQTNDVVEFSDVGFIWRGRADWAINTGGIKVHPEEVEARISAQFPDNQVSISFVPDEQLGQKVVLFTTESILDKLKMSGILSAYELPKKEIIVAQIPLLDNQKVDRRALLQLAQNE